MCGANKYHIYGNIFELIYILKALHAVISIRFPVLLIRFKVGVLELIVRVRGFRKGLGLIINYIRVPEMK